MCLIVDANVADKWLGSSRSAILRWLLGAAGTPRLVAAGKLRLELSKIDAVRKILVELERAGRLRSVDTRAIDQDETRLSKSAICESNDRHVLALARISGARTLATSDNALARDFKNTQIIHGPRGKIYRDPDKHGGLLGHTTSCGVKAKTKRARS